jgi:hypothetical protein
MADLMAYLQLVANNSSNLPLTRRDDPELGRTVSSLTPEEYATKCAAFVPSMVRIVGGQYGKYGSVWDLKTSEVSGPPRAFFVCVAWVECVVGGREGGRWGGARGEGQGGGVGFEGRTANVS